MWRLIFPFNLPSTLTTTILKLDRELEGLEVKVSREASSFLRRRRRKWFTAEELRGRIIIPSPPTCVCGSTSGFKYRVEHDVIYARCLKCNYIRLYYIHGVGGWLNHKQKTIDKSRWGPI